MACTGRDGELHAWIKRFNAASEPTLTVVSFKPLSILHLRLSFLKIAGSSIWNVGELRVCGRGLFHDTFVTDTSPRGIRHVKPKICIC